MFKKTLAMLTLAASPLVASATVIDMDIYTVLRTSPGDGVPDFLEVNFFNPKPAGTAPATLTIRAEGVDLSENDSVSLNGNFLGLLTHQTYNFCCFDLQLGPGDLGFGQTESLDSFIDIFVELNPGLNTLRIDLDPGNWIAEIETIHIEIPEPTSVALAGLALLGLAASRRRS